MVLYNLGTNKGEKGADGEKGATGETGATGANGKDGIGLKTNWDGTSLGVKREDEPVFTYVDLQGPKGEKGDKGDQGLTGYIFTPSIDSEGNVSWTNNGGLTNPATVNVKGSKGDTGATGPQGIQGIQGEKGDKGEKGDTMVSATIVQTLPDPTDTSLVLNSLYYVPNAEGSGDDLYTEYFLMEVNGTRRFEKLGEKSLAELADYYTKTEINALISTKTGSDVDFFNDLMNGTISDNYVTTTGLEYTTLDSVNVLHSTAAASSLLNCGVGNGTYNVVISSKSSTNGNLSFVLYTDASNYYSINFNPTTGEYKILQDKAGTSTTLVDVTQSSLITTGYYNMIINAKGTAINCTVNGASFNGTVDSTLIGGSFKIELPTATYVKTLEVYTNTKNYIDNVLGSVVDLTADTLTILGN